MKKIADFFNNLADGWQDVDSEYAVRDEIIQLAGLPRNSRVLDVGCGTGVMFEHILKASPASITGVDVSEEMIRRASRRYDDERIECLCRDFINDEMPQADAVIIFNAYPHFLDKPALNDALARNLSAGNIAVIAHSRPRGTINHGHTGAASGISVPLEPAVSEAAKFLKNFEARLTYDAEFYFIKLVRK